jgi:hypothetical protein
MVQSGGCLTRSYAYRDKKVVGVFIVRFSCAASINLWSAKREGYFNDELEIYNAFDFKADLEKRTYFKSTSDAEIVFYLYFGI